MKKHLFLSLFVILFGMTTAPLSFAQEAEEPVQTALNPGDDPNEAMIAQGAGVPNYGCPDSSRSCYAKLKHGRLGDDTAFRPAGPGASTPGGVGSGTEGTR